MQSSETYLFILNRTSLYTIFLKGTGKASEREKKKHFIFNYEVLLVRQQISGPNKVCHKKFNLNEHISFNPLKLLS